MNKAISVKNISTTDSRLEELKKQIIQNQQIIDKALQRMEDADRKIRNNTSTPMKK